MNTIKTALLMTVLTVMLIVIGNLIGGKGGMLIAFMFALIMNFTSYWFSDKLILRMYHAQETSETENPELYRMVESLTSRANIPKPKIYIIPSDQPNAFATGRNPQNSAIALTTGIIKLLNREELSGVIAHELSHIKNRDILVGTIAATIAGAITMLANMAQWALIFGSRSSSDRDENPLALLVTIIVAPIAAMMIQLAISRSREFMADESGAKISTNPLYLASALRKLHVKSQQIPMQAQPATAHMFIVNPLSARGFTKLFSTHPPIEERIARLESMVYGGNY